MIFISAAVCCNRVHDGPILRPVTRADSAYVALIKRLLEAPADQDYTILRMTYAKTTFYNPYDRIDTLGIAMQRCLIKKDYKKAVEYAQASLAKNYLNIRAHIVCDISYKELGDSIKSVFHQKVARGLIRSILESGDGRSFKTAYIIIAVPEEYILLDILGLRTSAQMLIEHEGSSFDRLAALDNRTGDSLTLFFNVDIPLTWVDARSK